MHLQFDWDDKKAAGNLAKHGVSFEKARSVFLDPFAIDWLDERRPYPDDRHCILGMSNDRLIFVAYTVRGDKIRLISARGAEPYEQRRYHGG